MAIQRRRPIFSGVASLLLFVSLVLETSVAFNLPSSSSSGGKNSNNSNNSNSNNRRNNGRNNRSSLHQPILSDAPNNDAQQQSSSSSQIEEKDSFIVTVTHEGRTCDINVSSDETILSALERNSDLLAVSQMPSDCRRGNCMTCAGRVLCTGTNNIISDENGLSPDSSKQLSSSSSLDDNDDNYILTCCSHVVGEGVHLELGEYQKVWKKMYQTRFKSPEAQQVKRETVAKLLRVVAESNPTRWKQTTERALKRSSSDHDD